jgi:hypothetical protein
VDYKEEEIEVVNPEPNEKKNLNEEVISKNENSQQLKTRIKWNLSNDAMYISCLCPL